MLGGFHETECKRRSVHNSGPSCAQTWCRARKRRCPAAAPRSHPYVPVQARVQARESDDACAAAGGGVEIELSLDTVVRTHQSTS